MKTKSKGELKKALAEIMQKADQGKELTDSVSARETLEWIAKTSFEALDKPSAADLANYLKGICEPAQPADRKPRRVGSRRNLATLRAHVQSPGTSGTA